MIHIKAKYCQGIALFFLCIGIGGCIYLVGLAFSLEEKQRCITKHGYEYCCGKEAKQ
jgi:hypothetical protein